MKRALILTFSLAIILLAGCEKDTEVDYEAIELQQLDDYISKYFPKALKDESGMYVIEETEGTGNTPNTEEYALVNYTFYTLNLDVFNTNIEENAKTNQYIYTSKKRYAPTAWKIGSMSKCISIALTKMKEGGKIKLAVPSSLTGNPTSYTSVIIELELITVIKDIDVYEQDIIADYITKSELNFIKKESGIYVAITQEGTGDKYTGDKPVTITKYTGKYIDNKTFDTGSLTIFDGSTYIDGFSLAVKEMNAGCKSTTIIPYKLAYGEKGNGTIETYETLIFELESKAAPSEESTTK